MKNMFTRATILFVPLALASWLPAATGARAEPVRIGVVSDIHVYNDGHVHPNFTRLVRALAARPLAAVVVDGDFTSGNAGDSFTIARVRRWWDTVVRSIAPLQAAGIPVFPVAGNHDSYRDVHRTAYAEGARRILAANPGKAKLSGFAPLYYSTELEGIHLDLLHVVDQDIGRDIQAWLTQDLARATEAKLRLAFGHVPLRSNMGHTSTEFLNRLGRILLDGGVAAYIAGHEHLFWDERLEIDGRRLREVTVGTASAAYVFPLSPETFEASCSGSVCRLPATGAEIALRPGSRFERDEVSFVELEINGASLDVHPFTLSADGTIVPFGVTKP